MTNLELEGHQQHIFTQSDIAAMLDLITSPTGYGERKTRFANSFAACSDYLVYRTAEVLKTFANTIRKTNSTLQTATEAYKLMSTLP